MIIKRNNDIKEEKRHTVKNKYTGQIYENVLYIIEVGGALLLVWSDLKGSERVYKKEVEIETYIMRF